MNSWEPTIKFEIWTTDTKLLHVCSDEATARRLLRCEQMEGKRVYLNKLIEQRIE